MKKIFWSFAIILTSSILTIGCQEKASEPGGQAGGDAGMEMDMPLSAEGIVVSTQNAAGYTYVEVEKDGKKFWAAGPATEVKVGDKVTLPGGSMMSNFQSKTLGKTFDQILFASAILVEGAEAPAAGGMHGGSMGGMQGGGMGAAPTSGDTGTPEAGSIVKAEGGLTVVEVFEKKGEFGGKSVTVRGKVVKANKEIMGKNWYHIQDGTGAEGTNDLLVTSTQNADAGNVVLVKGVLSLNKDFGSGYQYALLIEDAEITVE